MLLVVELLGAEQGAACLVFPFFAQMMIVALVCCVHIAFHSVALMIWRDTVALGENHIKSAAHLYWRINTIPSS